MRPNSQKSVGTCGGTFAYAEPQPVANGLLRITSNGKRPLLRGWQHGSLREIRATMPGLIERYGEANVALSCGASSSTADDADVTGIQSLPETGSRLRP